MRSPPPITKKNTPNFKPATKATKASTDVDKVKDKSADTAPPFGSSKPEKATDKPFKSDRGAFTMKD